MSGFLEFVQNFARQLRFDLGMGFQNKFLLLLCALNQFVGGAVGFNPDKDANFLGLCERRVKFLKTTDEKIADETIKKARVVTEQDAKAVTETFAGLVRDECQVG